MTNPPQPEDRLSDPVFAARAWARFRWIMRWVIAAAVLSVAAALTYLWADGAPLNIPVVVATTAGVALTVLLGGALMGLVFMSSGSGHDEDVAKFAEQSDPSSFWDRRR